MYRFPSYLAARHHEVRDHVRRWIADHPDPAPADFARGGLVAPGWPTPWGLGAGVGGQLVVRHELAAAGLSAPLSEIEVNWIGPTILGSGSGAQRDRYLWPMLEGREKWCRLHSEPDAGSDLSMIATRAHRISAGYRIRGQKVWTYNAAAADFGAVLARTSGSAGEAEGISYFIVAMDSPGLTILPIKDLSGGSTVSEVFFDDVVVPEGNLIGDPGAGLVIRRPNRPVPTVPFNPGFAAGHDPALLRLIDLADCSDWPAATAEELLDLYVGSQSIDALAVLDAEEEHNSGSVAPQRADIRRWLTQEFRRDALELSHEVRAEAESLGRRTILQRLDERGVKATILRAAVATVPNGGSDIHLETVTARLLGGGSPVLTAWVGDDDGASPERLAAPILGSEHEMLRASLRRFRDDLADTAADATLDPGNLESLEALALRDLLSADSGGGPDVDWLAWVVAFEELGSSPIGATLLASVGLGGVVLHLACGDRPDARDMCAAALAADRRLALAVQEPGLQWARGEHDTRASGGSRPLLTGTKIKVAQASSADALVVFAVEDGRTHVYAVDPRTDGVTIVDEPAVEAALAFSTVRLEDAPAVRLSDGEGAGVGWSRALSFAKVAVAAHCVGSASRALGLAVDYLRDRRQFGKALRDFQAVSHRCGRSRIVLEQMRALAYRAALEGAGADWDALEHSSSIARMLCTDGYASVTAEAMRAQGAIGITWENVLGAHYRRAYWLRELLGGRAVERRLILDQAITLGAQL